MRSQTKKHSVSSAIVRSVSYPKISVDEADSYRSNKSTNVTGNQLFGKFSRKALFGMSRGEIWGGKCTCFMLRVYLDFLLMKLFVHMLWSIIMIVLETLTSSLHVGLLSRSLPDKSISCIYTGFISAQ